MAQTKQAASGKSHRGHGAKSQGLPSFKNILRILFTSWRRRVLEVVFVVTLLAVFHEQTYDVYAGIRDAAISSLALGLLPVTAYVGLFVWMYFKKRPALKRRWNLWVGSAFWMASLLGFMAYWRGGQGILNEVTVGGDWGHSIRSGNAYFGVVRLTAITLVGCWIAFPQGTPRELARAARYLMAAATATSIALKHAWIYGKLAAVASYTYVSVGASHVLQTLGIAKNGLQKGKLPPSAESPSPELDDVHGERAEEDGEDSSLQFQSAHPADEGGQSQANLATGANGTAKGTKAGTDAKVNGALAPASLLQNQAAKSHVKNWKLPSTRMLWEAPEVNISDEAQKSTAATIEHTLLDYGIEVKVKKIRPGPTVTMYGLEPGWNRRYKEVKEKDKKGMIKLDERGRAVTSMEERKTRVKVDTIVAREKDLALALAAQSIRIEAPVPNESFVGIEVPNPTAGIVTIRSVMESDAYRKLRPRAQLPIAMGKGSGGEVVVTDLARMPHMLIAGATGSGKSVCINSIISCLIMERSPMEMRLLLIDPKRVELNLYNGIPHLLRPTVVETADAVRMLKGVINEMLKRYKIFEEVGVRNIQAHNKKMPQIMPYIVVVIDELADLMMTSQYEAEGSLCRLAQLGRATGIHLVVATQRPSVNVVTGLIKANFPSRISFAVASQVDSRTILDSAGADKLLGRGDMLYMPLDGLKPKRCQGVFISDQEIESLVSYWTTYQGPPVPEIKLEIEDEGAPGGESEYPEDALLNKARELTNSYTKISTSLLQRKLRIGYPRAARLMEQLEDEGLVNAGDSGSPKDVTTNWS